MTLLYTKDEEKTPNFENKTRCKLTYLSTQKKIFSITLIYINKILSFHVIFTTASDEQDYRPITESFCLRFFFYFRIENEGVKSILFHTQSFKKQIQKFCIEFQDIHLHTLLWVCRDKDKNIHKTDV